MEGEGWRGEGEGCSHVRTKSLGTDITLTPTLILTLILTLTLILILTLPPTLTLPLPLPLPLAPTLTRYIPMGRLWVQCDACDKWRRLTETGRALPAVWRCELNPDARLAR